MNYKVNSGFMAFQFEKPTYCFSIECNALKEHQIYHCTIGKKEVKTFDVTYDDALELVGKYGEDKIIRKQRGKNVFIIPVSEVS